MMTSSQPRKSKYKMFLRTKTRSVSVEDLSSIVNQMIAAAPNNKGLLAKLHQVVYAEGYYTKLAEEKKSKAEVKFEEKQTIGNENIETGNRRQKGDTEDLVDRTETVNLNEETENLKPELIEVWSKIERKIVLVRDLSKQDRARSIIPVEYRSRGDIAFENWRRKKTKTYERFLKDQQRRRQRDRTARVMEAEKKQAAAEVYRLWRKHQQNDRKMSSLKKKEPEDSGANIRKRSDEKRTANAQASKAWERQKDVQMKEKQMYRAYAQQGYQQREVSKQQEVNRGTNISFDLWLDQLDCVLHQKYLRERRYLVRSFYCQPAYYGTATLCTR